MADKYNKQRVEFRRKRVEAGFCRDCGGSPQVPGKSICAPCVGRRDAYNTANIKRRRALGKCHSCEKPAPDKTQCVDCSAKQIDRMRETRKRNKLFIYDHFGGKCLHCGETDIRVMTLDHVDGDGVIDKLTDNGKKQISTAWYAKLVKLIQQGKELPRRLQMLCFNCHAKKDLTPWWHE